MPRGDACRPDERDFGVSCPLLRTGGFVRAAQKMVRRKPHLGNELRRALELLAVDMFDPRLRTHKLKGPYAGIMACSAGYDLRILFKAVEHNGKPALLLLTVGTHEEVY